MANSPPVTAILCGKPTSWCTATECTRRSSHLFPLWNTHVSLYVCTGACRLKDSSPMTLWCLVRGLLDNIN